MNKIPTVFVRDEATNRKHVKDEVTPGCEWVLSGEGEATRKYDGTCCMVRSGVLYRRQEITDQQLVEKGAPEGWELVERDVVTAKNVGWVPVGDGPNDVWHRSVPIPAEDGTYELVGPKVQGNPEGYTTHHLIAHADAEVFDDVPRDFDGLRAWLLAHPYEGIVWHHPDGRMAKLKRRDFPAAVESAIPTADGQ